MTEQENSIKIKYDIITLETILVKHYRPYFLHIESRIAEGNDLHIVLSCPLFCVMTVEERTQKVFNMLKNEYPRILEEYTPIIQCYNNTEMEQALDLLFEKEKDEG